MREEAPLGVEIPDGLTFKTIDEAFRSIGSGEPPHTVVDSNDAVVDKCVVSGEFKGKFRVVEAGAKFTCEVFLWVNVGRTIFV